MSNYELYLGDCLVEMLRIPDHSIDCICADLPYGTTACAWDTVIPLNVLWVHYKRIIKPTGAIVLFGSFPFSGALWESNPEWFKYTWAWEKSLVGDVMNAKNKPLKKHEDILVFSDGTTANCSNRLMTYNPQGLRKKKHQLKTNGYRHDGQDSFKPKRPSHNHEYVQENEGYPVSVLHFDNGNFKSFHPTQKPVALLEYLIKTYTNPGETVLDNTAGSFSTGVACLQTGRNFIGIEKDPEFFAIGKRRMEDADLAAQGLPKQLTGSDSDYADMPLWKQEN